MTEGAPQRRPPESGGLDYTARLQALRAPAAAGYTPRALAPPTRPRPWTRPWTRPAPGLPPAAQAPAQAQKELIVQSRGR